MSDARVKETAEGTEALKADLKTDVCHAKLVRAQQFLGLFNATLDQILVWSLVEGVPEQSENVITRDGFGVLRFCH